MQRSRLRGAGFLSGTLGSMIVALAMCNTTLDPHSEPLSHCTAIFHTWETLGPGWHGIAREPGKRQSHEAFRQLQQNGPQRIPDACHRRHFFFTPNNMEQRSTKPAYSKRLPARDHHAVQR